MTVIGFVDSLSHVFLGLGDKGSNDVTLAKNVSYFHLNNAFFMVPLV